MDKLVRSNVIYVESDSSIVINLTIPNFYENINILSGTIYNKCRISKRRISDITISLQKRDEQISFATISNICGEYLFTNIPTGEYVIIFSSENVCICYDYIRIGCKMNNCYNAYI